jgi:hypothetical protein
MPLNFATKILIFPPLPVFLQPRRCTVLLSAVTEAEPVAVTFNATVVGQKTQQRYAAYLAARPTAVEVSAPNMHQGTLHDF